MIMMIFTSVYGVVDGFFVSNYVGKTPFAAVNVIMPFLMIFGAVGFMTGAGGSALVSMTFGTGNKKKANEIFSLLIYLLIAVGAVFSAVGIIFVKPVAAFLGASKEMLPYCVTYGRIILLALVPFMLQNVFQSFLVTAEKPMLGLAVTVISGVTNMTLDALFMGVFKWGVSGAAAATAISQFMGGVIPFVYFLLPNKSKLKLSRTHMDIKSVIKACTNGSSEFMTNVSISLVSMLYNHRLMTLSGENGVAAYGVIMYVAFIFLGVFLGYSIGSAPVIGFHYGANNIDELKGLLRKSLKIVAALRQRLVAWL